MLPAQTFKPKGPAFIYQDGGDTISRDKIVLASGQNLPSGAVLGVITAGGKFTQLNPAASNGSQVAAGILWEATDAGAADTPATAVTRLQEVVGTELVWPAGITDNQKATATGQLAALNIIVRW